MADQSSATKHKKIVSSSSNVCRNSRFLEAKAPLPPRPSAKPHRRHWHVLVSVVSPAIHGSSRPDLRSFLSENPNYALPRQSSLSRMGKQMLGRKAYFNARPISRRADGGRQGRQMRKGSPLSRHEVSTKERPAQRCSLVDEPQTNKKRWKLYELSGQTRCFAGLVRHLRFSGEKSALERWDMDTGPWFESRLAWSQMP